MRQTEAADRAQYVEAALGRLNDGERTRADGWREAAHDLRGRLGVVKTAAALLSRTELSEKQREQSLQTLTKSIDWMSAFLNDLMELSRLEAGHERRQIRRLDVARLFKELCNDLRTLANERRLFLTVEGPPEMSVDGDEVKILRIAQNLLYNALLYTKAGGVKVTWALDATLDTNRWVLCVQDTGSGLQHGTVTSIADALKTATDLEHETVDQQLVGQVPDMTPAVTLKSESPEEPSRGPSGEGVGLGIVKRLCELLDATIELQTEPGKGTTFRVAFPLHYEERGPFESK
jgi:signal transduction histidine kinase